MKFRVIIQVKRGAEGRRGAALGVPAVAESLGGTAQLILAGERPQRRGCCPKASASVLFSQQRPDYTVNP